MRHGWMGWNHGMGWGGGLMMVLFWILVILAVIFFIRPVMGRGGMPWGASRPSDEGRAAAQETALDILKKRYARGEITRAEFERMKSEIK